MQLSTIQLDEFNDCPGVLAVKQYLYSHRLADVVDVVDIPSKRTSWFQNSTDQLVLALQQGPQEARIALAIGQMATEFAADELSWIDVDGQLVVRLWWD